MDRFDVVVIGAGAAGMMCAVEAAKRGRRVLVLDHGKAPGEKIRISGGGRCNFTNLETTPDRFISENPRFCISALERYRPADIVALFEQGRIAWRERTLGQLFCEGPATQVVALFQAEMARHGVVLRLATPVRRIDRAAEGFRLGLDGREAACSSLVIATGGKSIPKMGASGFGYAVAEQFGLRVVAPRPGLVPLTLEPALLERLIPLAGVSVPARVASGGTRFEEALLFTHRGLSGPAILQISSFWRSGSEIEVDMAPGVDMAQTLRRQRTLQPRQAVASVLAMSLPRRLAQVIAEREEARGAIADAPNRQLDRIAGAVNAWRVRPAGSEGYRTAEVTLGGVDTRGLDGRTMAARAVPGLFFIGEVVDVTGWLGGYNFQWAWASGWCAGQVV